MASRALPPPVDRVVESHVQGHQRHPYLQRQFAERGAYTLAVDVGISRWSNDCGRMGLDRSRARPRSPRIGIGA